ncbi:unnamed protein product [Nippostrongylus brasiliensis]|uniref:Uncharacterized protein n=1 Tax=Nippostrongylus brasiliensis TaxID=27835 RepID=A0A0N4YF32_NIPBR|nr:unnamed protein product [Nippostrongylus brasiliensis]
MFRGNKEVVFGIVLPVPKDCVLIYMKKNTRVAKQDGSGRPIGEDPAFEEVVGTSASQSTVPTTSSKAGSSSATSSKFEDVVLQETNPKQFFPAELDLLLDRYVENYDTFHHAVSGATREETQSKKKFIIDLTEEIYSLGYARRSEKQVEQRIRDEIKLLKRYVNAVRSEVRRTGGGRVFIPRLTAAQMRAYNTLQDRPRVSGLPSGIEPTSRQEEPRRLRPREQSRPRPAESMRPSRPVEASRVGAEEQLSVGSAEGSRPSSRSTVTSESLVGRFVSQKEILVQEMSNLQLRHEVLTKKSQVLDLQIKYWTKKTKDR